MDIEINNKFIEYTYHRRPHRIDGPAREYFNGTKLWFFNGIQHREDGPAEERPNDFDWRLNRLYHRTDGPARKWADDRKEWWVNGERHRPDGPAVEYKNGSYEWYLNDLLHRDDGPSRHLVPILVTEFKNVPGFEEWHQYGKLHRENGPAVIYFNGKGNHVQYWFCGLQYEYADYCKLLKLEV